MEPISLTILKNEEWYYIDKELDLIIPTDNCPVHVLVNYNDYMNNLFFLGHNLSIEEIKIRKNKIFSISRFIEMRKRIGYTDEKIDEEIKLIFSLEEIDDYKKDLEKNFKN